MAVCSTRLLLALAVVVGALHVPAAVADTPLPDARTHVDPAGVDAPASSAGDEGPRLTLLVSDTSASDIRRGYLYVKARCDQRCAVEVTATTKINGKQREVAFKRQTLRAKRATRIRLKIRSDVRRRIAAGARFRFVARPYPVD